jgi:hypothetical protein
MIKKTLKSVLSRILPEKIYATITAIRARKFIEQVEERTGLKTINKMVETLLGRTVRQGPFRGMEYTEHTSHRHVTQRILGCYEEELHPVIERCIAKGYSRIVDVGCAEGYYAVGLSKAIPNAQVFAFDTDPWARMVCKALAEANQRLESIHIEGFCNQEWLRRNAVPEMLIISDCEGYEAKLFQGDSLDWLSAVDLIIEIHDMPPSDDHWLVKRFRKSHDVKIIHSRARNVDDFGFLHFLTNDQKALAISDMRVPWQGWIFCESRTTNTNV